MRFSTRRAAGLAFILAATVSLSAQAHSGHAHQGHGGPGQPAAADASGAAAPDGVTASGCWIRALPNRLPSAGYLELRNEGVRDAVLIGARAAAFGKVMLHESKTVNGMAVMAHAHEVVVPAGGGVEFLPGGRHIMLEDPVSELRIGSTLPLTLLFEGDRAMTTACEVRSAAGVK